MGAVSADEQAGIDMDPTWRALPAVKEFYEEMEKFIRQELPADCGWNAAGMTTANALAAEFRTEIWPHRVPTCWELILADRAGHLEETISELNEAYSASQQV